MQHGEETHFKLNKTANMELVFDTYAKRKGIQTTDSIRFLLHNEEIRPNQTPNKLQLKDDDKIDCVVPTPAPITIRIRDQVSIAKSFLLLWAKFASLNSLDLACQYGEETHFKLPETMKMQKVFNAYMKHKWICRWYHICFELNGVEIGPDQTPKTLELKDHDIVYFVTKPHVLDSTPITIRLRELREVRYADIVHF
jgi:Ubiquitin-2 like Rad60 SUMO-like